MEIKYYSESSSQHCCGSSHKCVALVGCFAFTLLSSSSQTISMGFKSGDCAGHSMIWSLPSCSSLLRSFWHSLEVCFGSLSCCRMNPWPTRRRPEYCMALQNAVVALLVQGASHSVQVADSGSSERAPDHHASSSMFDNWCHTLRNHPFTYLTAYKNPVMNRRFQILIHRSIRPSSSSQ